MTASLPHCPNASAPACDRKRRPTDLLLQMPTSCHPMDTLRTTVSLLTHAAGDADSRTVVRDCVELAVRVEELGLHSFWLAQHHFGAQAGHVPSG
jgi:hypothetical protein